MNHSEKQSIHALFEAERFSELYQLRPETINWMLSIEDEGEFEDFLENDGFLEEDVFWLFDAAVHGTSLMIGGYEGAVTENVTDFLKKHLSSAAFDAIQKELQGWYVDMDEKDNLQEKVDSCNQCLEGTGASLRLDFDDTSCAGVYFLSVNR